jgi:DNA repair exonuclease SbcCD ATPase subunit
MNDIEQRMKRFERRVRLVRSWRGMAIGLCLGAAACAVWSALDWAGIAYTDWSKLGVVLASTGVLGLVAGWFQRVSSKALSDSIDRRAGLEDRLTTSLERANVHEGFEQALHADAQKRVSELKPASLYPVRVGRWQTTAVMMSALAASIFLLGNTPILLSEDAKKAREELKQAGQAVEKITKPLEDPKEQNEMSPEEKKLLDEMRKLNRELEKGRMDKKEALQKANELAKEAERLMKERAKMTDQNLAEAETAFDKMKKDALEQAGMGELDPKLAEMSEAERDSLESQLNEKINALQKQLSSIEEMINKGKKEGMSEEDLKKLQDKKDALKNQLGEAQEQLKQVKLSKDAQELLDRIAKNPIFKEIQEMAKKLAENSKSAQQKGQPSLTKEQVKQMQKRMEEMAKKLDELAKQLKDDKALNEYLEKMKEALKNGCGT